MEIHEIFPGLNGFYMLTNKGELGFYTDEGPLQKDDALTKTFLDYNRQFLKAYAQDTEKPDVRIGIIFHTEKKHPWGSSSFALETETLRRLYPVSGSKEGDPLTTFQKKHQEQSIFRAMELLLEYKTEHSRTSMSYCPVLFYRKSRLKHYTHIEAVDGNDLETPVLEVLNLAAFVPVERRDGPAITGLKQAIHTKAIHKDRRDSMLTLIERRNFGTAAALNDPFAGERKDIEGVTIPDCDEDDLRAWMKQHWGDITSQSLGSWLVQPYRYAIVDNLKVFQRFRRIGFDHLPEIAEHCPIFQAPVGTRLLERGTNDHWNLYLLEGTIELEAEDGATKKIAAGAETASAPISFLKPRKYAVRAVTDVRFLFINDDYVSQFPVHDEIREDSKPGNELPDFMQR